MYQKQHIDHLIHAKWVITCEEDNQVLENYALAIKEGHILAIAPSQEIIKLFSATDEIHYSTHAILPGLINSHTHAAMTFFRGFADDLDLMDWLHHAIWPMEKKWLSDEFVYDATLLAISEMLRCGTTCFNDMYFFMDATARAVERAGLRAHIGLHVIDVPTAWATTFDDYLAKAILFYQKYKNHPRITPTLAPHSTYTLSAAALHEVKAIADEHHLKINIHLQESHAEIEESLHRYQQRPLQRLHTMNMVSPQLIAIHMTQLNQADFALLQATKPNIICCPESNMKLANGACPIETLLHMGLNVALGTDGAASNNDLDMLGEMHTAALISKMTTRHLNAVPADTILKMATLYGARALGVDHLIGSLTPGKAADFIAIDLEQIETQPLYHPVSQIVYSASRHQVTDVWVAGKPLLKNRQLLTLDEKAIINKAAQWSQKIKASNERNWSTKKNQL